MGVSYERFFFLTGNDSSFFRKVLHVIKLKWTNIWATHNSLFYIEGSYCHFIDGHVRYVWN